MKIIHSIAGFGALSLLLTTALAADLTSPVGKWRTIDDKSGKPKSIVQITEDKGVLTGKIVELLEGATEKTCSKCEGDLKDKPLVGMKILWDLKKEGNEWADGKIFNPADGGTYTSKAKLTEGGKTLEVTGKWMFFSKQQQWQRVN
ncbi:MAG TPA: DUF2147 domain-containing protein [Candidatus Competibacteraceae bacterium]|nr:DUF2147 domain-containing protein [Candidatus Competibacteraceae bacterium]HRZ07499.1 DUF2147 domain-containing protein [Candidatus Competibacteraceae bacterium]HSA47055.1 DUF2147 domain-containing protein [Candidatus Competibacteraceae bacterium]